MKEVLECMEQNAPLLDIVKKVINHLRITEEEGVKLYEEADLALLGSLANHVRRKKNNDHTFFNKNFHIEPTNICLYNCEFCAYSRKKGEKGSWEYSHDDILDKVSSYKESSVTEVHIVGGVHPDRDLQFYGELLQKIKKLIPDIHIKAFTAVELDHMIKKSGLSPKEGLLKLKEYGLDSIPGGGAEIFDEGVRRKICGEKSSSQLWLEIHETAHKAGIPSNATMLYGHVENYRHRIDHLKRLRDLQDKTGMFNAFIPLKYKSRNNHLSEIGEVSMVEDLRNYAVSRIFLDNFDHIKAYWPMIGKETAQLALSFGVDDMDGTIDDSTQIYSMAGAEEQKPSMSTQEIIQLIKEVNLLPVERDSVYNILKEY